MRNKLTIGLFGYGVVGSGLYEILNQSRLVDAYISRIVVKHPEKERNLPADKFFYDKKSILEDPEINVVVELINDSEAALHIVRAALSRGKHVVSANKKLIAENLDELILLAKRNNVSFLYEASVAGSIPILRNLEEYYNNDTLTSVQGIVNGTTNYILTRANHGITYDEALSQAQVLGFAESDPTLDVDGFDSKYKLVLLIKHAFGIVTGTGQVFNYGIRHIKPADVAYAAEKSYRIKLFSRAEKVGDRIVGFVAPHFIRQDHFAYQVDNEFNALVVEAAFSDKQLFIGKGAGSFPTASAVLSDISALQYDYQYEYKKSFDAEPEAFSEDFFLKIYLGSPFIEAIQEIPFYTIDEVFQSREYNYQTGWVRFSELRQHNFNGLKELFFAVLPDAFLSPEAFSRIGEENLFLQVFNN